MAEVVGLAASVLQIGGAGAKLSIELYNFISTASRANSDVTHIAVDVEVTSKVLGNVGKVLEGDHAKKLVNHDAIQHAKDLIKQCKEVFNELSEVVDKARKTGKDGKARIGFRAKMTWPMKEQRVELLRRRLETLKTSLLVLFHVLQLAQDKARGDVELAYLEEQKKNIRDLHHQQQASLRILKALEQKLCLDTTDDNGLLQRSNPPASPVQNAVTIAAAVPAADEQANRNNFAMTLFQNLGPDTSDSDAVMTSDEGEHLTLDELAECAAQVQKLLRRIMALQESLMSGKTEGHHRKRRMHKAYQRFCRKFEASIVDSTGGSVERVDSMGNQEGKSVRAGDEGLWGERLKLSSRARSPPLALPRRNASPTAPQPRERRRPPTQARHDAPDPWDLRNDARVSRRRYPTYHARRHSLAASQDGSPSVVIQPAVSRRPSAAIYPSSSYDPDSAAVRPATGRRESTGHRPERVSSYYTASPQVRSSVAASVRSARYVRDSDEDSDAASAHGGHASTGHERGSLPPPPPSGSASSIYYYPEPSRSVPPPPIFASSPYYSAPPGHPMPRVLDSRQQQMASPPPSQRRPALAHAKSSPGPSATSIRELSRQALIAQDKSRGPVSSKNSRSADGASAPQGVAQGAPNVRMNASPYALPPDDPVLAQLHDQGLERLGEQRLERLGEQPAKKRRLPLIQPSLRNRGQHRAAGVNSPVPPLPDVEAFSSETNDGASEHDAEKSSLGGMIDSTIETRATRSRPPRIEFKSADPDAPPPPANSSAKRTLTPDPSLSPSPGSSADFPYASAAVAGVAAAAPASVTRRREVDVSIDAMNAARRDARESRERARARETYSEKAIYRERVRDHDKDRERKRDRDREREREIHIRPPRSHARDSASPVSGELELELETGSAHEMGLAWGWRHERRVREEEEERGRDRRERERREKRERERIEACAEDYLLKTERRTPSARFDESALRAERNASLKSGRRTPSTGSSDRFEFRKDDEQPRGKSEHSRTRGNGGESASFKRTADPDTTASGSVTGAEKKREEGADASVDVDMATDERVDIVDVLLSLWTHPSTGTAHAISQS